jgi:NitT/TauT family transport system substrate-binding protein
MTRGRLLSVLSGVAAVMLALVVVGCGGDDASGSGDGGGGSADAGPTKVRVAYVPIGTLLPAFVAKDEGIFERNGLDVALTPIENVTTVPGTLGRQFDIGSATPPDTVKAVGQGLPVGAVTGATIDTEENTVGEIVVPKDSEIREIADLAGKKIATPSIGASMHVSLLNWLTEQGIDTKDLTAVETPFPTMSDQLKAGRVDAVEAVQPFLGLMLEAGNRSIGKPILSVGEAPVLSVLWLAHRDWANDNPETIEAWNRSMVEAEQFIEKDPKRSRTILEQYTQLPPEVAQSVQLPEYAASLTPEELGRGLVPWAEALENAGQFDGEVSAEQLVAGGES